MRKTDVTTEVRRVEFYLALCDAANRLKEILVETHDFAGAAGMRNLATVFARKADRCMISARARGSVFLGRKSHISERSANLMLIAYLDKHCPKKPAAAYPP